MWWQRDVSDGLSEFFKIIRPSENIFSDGLCPFKRLNPLSLFAFDRFLAQTQA